MEIRFATKRDVNGNRYYLTINTETHEYSRFDRWPHSEDLVFITSREMRRLIDACKAHGFVETETL